jgi:hypothetical protein
VSITDSLRTRPPEASKRSQSRSPHHPTACAFAKGCDCVEPVDRQLAQRLNVCAFGAQPLEQERQVCDREFLPVVDIGRITGGRVLALNKLLGYLA